MITDELKIRVTKEIQSCIFKAAKFDSRVISLVDKFTVAFSDKLGVCAGTACYESSEITINSKLFLQNIESFMTRTVRHETAHLLTHIMFPNHKQHHGPEFKWVAQRIDCPTTTYHNYNVESLRKVPRQFRYTCACDTPHMLTKIIHGKIQAGQARRCKTCNTRISYFPMSESE